MEVHLPWGVGRGQVFTAAFLFIAGCKLAILVLAAFHFFLLSTEMIYGDLKMKEGELSVSLSLSSFPVGLLEWMSGVPSLQFLRTAAAALIPRSSLKPEGEGVSSGRATILNDCQSSLGAIRQTVLKKPPCLYNPVKQ